MIDIRNIVLALNLDEENKALVEYAKGLAMKFDSKLWMIHVAAPDPDFVGYEPGPQYIRDTLAEELRYEHKLLQDYADNLKKEGITAEGLLIQGPTADMIVDEADKLAADLMVIGSHKHSWLYNTLIGSTSKEILNHAKIPLLIIPL